jgi:hypothetical protein
MPAKYQFVSGVVPGYGQSLQLSQPGWNQNLAIKLENIPGGMQAFLNNHLLSITWSVPAGTGGGYEQLGLFINAQGYGFNLQPGSVMSITGAGSLNGNTAELDLNAGSPVQTQTVTWDYSSILPAITAGGAGYIELIFFSNSGGGAPGTFYFNNATFGPQPSLTRGGLISAAVRPPDFMISAPRFAMRSPVATWSPGPRPFPPLASPTGYSPSHWIPAAAFSPATRAGWSWACVPMAVETSPRWRRASP